MRKFHCSRPRILVDNKVQPIVLLVVIFGFKYVLSTQFFHVLSIIHELPSTVYDKAVTFSINSRLPESKVLGRSRRFVGSWNVLGWDSLGRLAGFFPPFTSLFPNAGGIP